MERVFTIKLSEIKKIADARGGGYILDGRTDLPDEAIEFIVMATRNIDKLIKVAEVAMWVCTHPEREGRLVALQKALKELESE